MKTIEISFESLFVGLLLKFGKICDIDLEICINDLLKKGIVVKNKNILNEQMNNYCIKTGGVYYFVDTEFSRKLFLGFQNEVVSDYLNVLNVDEMTLKKIQVLKSVSEYLVPNIFNNLQEEAISKLLDNYLVNYVWATDDYNGDFMELELTSMGEAKLFELEHKNEIAEFSKVLIENKIDFTLITDYLRYQDYSMDVWEILDVDRFLNYCILNGGDLISETDKILRK